MNVETLSNVIELTGPGKILFSCPIGV